MSRSTSWLGLAVSVMGCLLLSTSVSAETVAAVSGWMSLSVHVDETSSALSGCDGATYSDVFSPPYGWQGDTQSDAGSDSLNITSAIEQSDVRNMAAGEGVAQVAYDSLYDDYACRVRAAGDGELTGPDYYLSDYAIAESYSHVSGFFTPVATQNALVYISAYSLADLTHAYPHELGMPLEQSPYAEVTLHVALWGPNGNMLTPFGEWQVGDGGVLEKTAVGQSVGYFYEDSDMHGFAGITLQQGVSYSMFAETIVEVQSPGGYVPEPATLSLLALGGLAVLRRRTA